MKLSEYVNKLNRERKQLKASVKRWKRSEKACIAMSTKRQLSKAKRRNWENKALGFRVAIIIANKEDCYAKSGGGKEREFNSYKEILTFATHIGKEIALRKTSETYTEALLRLARKYGKPEVKRVYIDKVGSPNGLRPLGIPAHKAKGIEYVILSVIAPIIAKELSEAHNEGIYLYGFLPGMSCKQVSKKVMNKLAEFPYALNLDASGAFDSLMREVRRMLLEDTFGETLGKACETMCSRPVTAKLGGIRDELGVISIHTPEWEIYRKSETRFQLNKKGDGTPQGGVISPAIYILAQLMCFKNVQRRSKNEGIESIIIGYADDAVVLTRNANEGHKVKEIMKEEMTKFGFQMNEHKSYHSFETLKMLGFEITSKTVTADTEHAFNRGNQKAWNMRNFKAYAMDTHSLLMEEGWSQEKQEKFNSKVDKELTKRMNDPKHPLDKYAATALKGVLSYYCDYKPGENIIPERDKTECAFIRKAVSKATSPTSNIALELNEEETQKYGKPKGKPYKVVGTEKSMTEVEILEFMAIALKSGTRTPTIEYKFKVDELAIPVINCAIMEQSVEETQPLECDTDDFFNFEGAQTEHG